MPVDPVKDFPGYALRRASAAAMARLAERLEALALRPAEATVLLVIEANPGITPSTVGRLLEIASANMAPLAARLQRRHLIVRERVNGRSHGLHLSEAGRRLARQAGQAMSEHEAQLLSRIPEAQRAAFLAALQALWTQQDE
jgi:DNA-binding MarR family transcriptional regulator